jgi:uncharacterized protein
MLYRLPQRIDPRRLADQGRSLQGDIPLSQMPRLRRSLLTAEGAAHVDLAFGIDGVGTPYVAGTVQARLRLTCQRCLRPLEISVQSRMSLGIVDSEAQAECLPECYEPLLLESRSIALAAMVEDDLILSLPIAPLHPRAVCDADVPAEMAVGPARDGPFAVLARLKEPHGSE